MKDKPNYKRTAGVFANVLVWVMALGTVGYAVSEDFRNYVDRTYRNLFGSPQIQYNVPRDEPASQPASLPIKIKKAPDYLKVPLPETRPAQIEKNVLADNPENRRLQTYIDAVIEIESGWNPNASRYEAHINDTSYGLGQILTRTARALEARHPDLPRLGKTELEVKASLCNPETNREYTKRLFEEEMAFYDNADLAVAAYNSGHLTPRNARVQEMLNDLYKTQLESDGRFGKQTREVIGKFQEQYGLDVDGVVGPKTYWRLQEVWQEMHPEKPNPKGRVPVNKYTPNHVRKFREACGRRN